jgi:coenzyme F420-reducing hydrogenase delta subunit
VSGYPADTRVTAITWKVIITLVENLHFSWISSAEATKFVAVANDVIQAVKDTGPASYLAKRRTEVV